MLAPPGRPVGVPDSLAEPLGKAAAQAIETEPPRTREMERAIHLRTRSKVPHRKRASVPKWDRLAALFFEASLMQSGCRQRDARLVPLFAPQINQCRKPDPWKIF